MRCLAELIWLRSNGFKLIPFQMAFRVQPGAICFLAQPSESEHRPFSNGVVTQSKRSNAGQTYFNVRPCSKTHIFSL
jgi:hypothetical protein